MVRFVVSRSSLSLSSLRRFSACHEPAVSRMIASTRSNSSTTATVLNPTTPIVELREYELYPSKSSQYRELATAQWEKQSQQRQWQSPLKCSLYPDTGSNTLNEAFHLYYFKGGYNQRDKVKTIMSKNKDWQQYSQTIKSCCIRQKSSIFVEAPLVQEMGLAGLGGGGKEETKTTNGTNTIFEVRRYQLQLGYDTVPRFLSLYQEGLPSKLNEATGKDPTTSLITLLYSEVGPLNHVIEVWKHGNGTAAMERSRVAARQAQEWRHAIAEIAGIAQQFNTAIYRPYEFSNMQ